MRCSRICERLHAAPCASMDIIASGDWSFTSAAASFGERAFAIVMSGLQNDGANGSVAVHKAGGKVIVQDPESCERPEMPTAAIATGAVDFVLPPDQVPFVLRQLLQELDVDRCREQWDAPFLFLADRGSS